MPKNYGLRWTIVDLDAEKDDRVDLDAPESARNVIYGRGLDSDSTDGDR